MLEYARWGLGAETTLLSFWLRQLSTLPTMASDSALSRT
jgi:hypothetical protein